MSGSSRRGRLKGEIMKIGRLHNIEIKGKKYEVTENLGFQHSSGYYVKAVKTEDGEKIVVKRDGIWIWWKASDRILPGGPVIGMSKQEIYEREKSENRRRAREANDCLLKVKKAKMDKEIKEENARIDAERDA